MNPIDNQLDRLFRAAGRPRETREAAPYGLETRVLAAWRGAESFNLWNNSLLVRGLILASLLMALSLWPALSGGSSPYADYLQLADSSLQVNNAP